MLYAIQLCEKCNWIGTHEKCKVKILPEENATIACPRCGEYTVTVPLYLNIRDILKGDLFSKTLRKKKRITKKIDLPTIKELEEKYCKAANALTEYRDKHGFEPGTKVMARYRKEPEKIGIIAPYGDAWSTANHMSVPVLLDNGVLQPWSMSNLTVITVESSIQP